MIIAPSWQWTSASWFAYVCTYCWFSIKYFSFCLFQSRMSPFSLWSSSDASYIFVTISTPGCIFSYCGRARAYTHVLARVYSTRASTCTLYTCFTLPHTCVNLTGLQLWVFQRARSFVNEIRTSMLSNKFFYGGIGPQLISLLLQGKQDIDPPPNNGESILYQLFKRRGRVSKAFSERL